MKSQTLALIIGWIAVAAAACGSTTGKQNGGSAGSSTGGTYATSTNETAGTTGSAGDSGPANGSLPDAKAGTEADASAPTTDVQPGAGADASGQSALPPPDGRCALTPRLLVSASAYPMPSDLEPGAVVKLLPGDFVVNASDLYYVVNANWTNSRPGWFLGGSVMRVPLRGGEQTRVAYGYVFTRPTLTATSLILSAENGYPYSYDDAILSIPLAGGPTTALVTFVDSNLLYAGPATDGTYAYYRDQSGIKAVPLTGDSGGSDIVTLTTDAATADGTEEIAVVGQRLIFSTAEGVIKSIALPPRDNSPITTLDIGVAGTTVPWPCGSSSVCWENTDDAGAQVIRIASASAITTMPLYSALADPSTSFDFDADKLYYMAASSADARLQLGRMNMDGTDPVILVTMPSGNAGFFQIDDECIYWLNQLGIFSLAKNAIGPFSQ